jgi:hypothetical protein
MSVGGDAAQLGQSPQVDHPVRRRPELAGDLDHHVGSTGDGTVRTGGEDAVSLGQRPGCLDRRHDGGGHAARSVLSSSSNHAGDADGRGCHSGDGSGHDARPDVQL